MISLKEKKSIVAGGCGLIGREIVRRFKQLGADVYSLDLSKKADIEFKISLDGVLDFRKVLDEYGPIDVFVNATYPKSPYTHFETYLMSSKNAAWHMKKHNGGAIVLLGSIYGIVGCDPRLYQGNDVQEPLIEYHACKAAINGMSKAIATLYGPYGVRCNVVSPGGVYNDQDDRFVKRYIKHVPLRRMGLPEDISGAVAFLVSDDASYITAENLLVGGGLTAYAYL